MTHHPYQQFRFQQLKALRAFLKECENSITEALRADLGRPTFESSTLEIGPLRTEISYNLKHLADWMGPVSVETPLSHQPGSAHIRYEPLGQILVIAPWNYPFLLTLRPLVNAISAGNQVTLKPSELAPHSSTLLAQTLPKYVDVEVHEGGPEVTTALLLKPWDHIVFTGSARVGKLVATQAAQHLTPMTLELGGKSPCVIEADCTLAQSAKRIAWGKFVNAGQTCVAPDYILVQRSIAESLTQELRQVIRSFFGENPEQSEHYGRIVNENHFERLTGLLHEGHIAHGGRHNSQTRYLEPTLVTDVPLDTKLMQEEIFGPILPIIPYDTLEEAFQFIKQRPKPLAAYLFSNQSKTQQVFLEKISAGSICLNDTVSHLGISALPFGGVGASGFGAYQGFHGFRHFSHAKAVYERKTWADLPVRYPPYSETARTIAGWFQR